jgi:hypothetical protein
VSSTPASNTVADAPDDIGPEHPDLFHLGSWVELHEEICRSGRTRRLLVNHRTHMALSLDAEEAEVIRALETESLVAEDPIHSDLLVELSEGGFLAGDEPELCRRGIRVSLTDFDVRWHGADGFVQALYRRGARCLFHPIAVVAQIALGLLGAFAVGVAVFSHAGLHLRVQPAQVPIILGLTVVAVAIHETAHALVVIRYGRSVDAMGFRLLLGAPSFYAESVDALLLTRRQRLIQAAAGPWAEWLVVSVIALWLLHSPDLLISPLLRRFIILNTATIASNLIPFAGLDGSWILGDALGEPDLHQRSRGALTRLITNALEGAPQAQGTRALAGYSTLNGLVSAALLATSAFFWYQLFGNVITELIHFGPIGLTVLVVATIVLGRPIVLAAGRRVLAAMSAAAQLVQKLRFRLEWRWRIPAVQALATSLPSLGLLDDLQLSALAGHLVRFRTARLEPAAAVVKHRGHFVGLEAVMLNRVLAQTGGGTSRG